MTHILAGDVGGTKTVLGLYRVDDKSSEPPPLDEIHKAVYPSAEHARFADLLTAFFSDVAPHRPVAACGSGGARGGAADRGPRPARQPGPGGRFEPGQAALRARPRP